MTEADARFVAAAQALGALGPDAARALLARATATGRPTWELLLAAGVARPTVEAALAAARRGGLAASGAGTWAGAAGPPGAHDRTLPLPAPAAGAAGPPPDDARTLVAPPAPPGPPPDDARTVPAPRTTPAGAGPAGAPRTTPAGARYEERGELGRGGMGRVLRVHDPAIGREVAKKVLLDPAADPATRARFVHEARVTGQLEHPAIVPVHEVGVGPDGAPYFTMKLVRGRSLAEVVRAARTDPALPAAAVPALLRAFLRVCEAIDYAHDRGVVHRDLKPGNVMLGDFGEVQVMDWGLAKLAGDDAPTARHRVSASVDAPLDATQEGAVVGTPAYMPPEQAEGGQADARSDVYSLGAILYELLTLRPPFQGDSPLSIVKKVLVDAPTPPRQAAPGRGIPRELEAIALKALEKDPAARYPSARALADDVQRALDGRPVSALPAGPLRRAAKWAARHAELTAAATVGLVLLAAGGGAAAAVVARADRARAAAAEARAAAEADAREKAEQARRADADRARLAEEKAEAERGRADAAARSARAARLLLDPSRYLNLNLSLAQLEAEVIAPLEEATRADPESALAHLELGVAWQRARKPERAAEALERAAALGAGAPASYLLGVNEERQGRREQAARHYARAASAGAGVFAELGQARCIPDRAQRLAALERLVERAGFVPEVALAYADEASWIPDDAVLVTRSREALRADEERLTAALAGLRPMQRTAQAQFGAHLARGALRALREDFVGAVDDFRLAEALGRQGGFTEARRVFELFSRMGHALLRLGREAEGLECLEKAAQGDAQDFHYDLLRGEYLLLRGRAAEAHDALRRADERLREHSPQHPKASGVVARRVVAAAEAGRLDAEAEAVGRLLATPVVTLPPLFPIADLDARVLRALGQARRSPALAALRPQVEEALRRTTRELQAALERPDLPDEARLQAAGGALAGLEALDDPDRVARLNLLAARVAAGMRTKRYAAAADDLRAGLALNDRGSPELRRRAAYDAYNLACAVALAGVRDGRLEGPAREEALRALEQAAEWGFDQPDVAARQPALAPLVADPRARAALERMRPR